MSEHVLLSSTRRVPAHRLAAYARGWRRLQDAATRAGVHAWRFRSTDRSEPARFLEFLEWRSDEADPLARTPVGPALAELDAAFPGERDSWHELPSEPSEEGNP